MQLWVGLGNPESTMRNNRHNIGFMAADSLASHYGGSPSKKANGDLVNTEIDKTRIILLKPLTYMNNSGECVQKIAHFYKIPPENIIVFHDDLDLNPGKVRVKFGGGTAGHNGLKSISSCLGTPDYWRVRLGIGHPGDRRRVHGWVLGNFSDQERQEWCDELLEKLPKAAPLLVSKQVEQFQNAMVQK